MHGIALVLTAILTATPSQRFAVTEGIPVAPTAAQVRTFLLFQFGGFGLVALIGIIILWIMWRKAALTREERRELEAA